MRDRNRLIPGAALLALALLAACGGTDDAGPAASGSAPLASAPACISPPVGQAGAGPVPSGDGGLVVTTSAGPIEGLMEEGVRAFMGVRFAAPPTGCLRFRAPADPVPVPGITPAQAPAPSCSQIFNGSALGQEDCLYLNLWAPQDRAVHAVLVLLHGGPINSANAARLAAQTGLVIVAPNRRIGVFGTLSLQQLADERADGATGTYAVMDTLAALRWVQRNIAAFGGDPTRVMVAGLSAGGSVACSLFATPSARGLFSAAAVLSGVCRPRLVVDASLARFSTAPPLKTVHSALIEQAGCSGVSNPLDCLRNQPAFDLLQAAAKLPALPAGGPAFPVAPVIDGAIVTSDPYSALESQVAGSFPVMAGSTRDEMRSLVTLPTMDDAAYRAFLGTFSASAVDALHALYPPSQYATPTDAAYTFLTELLFGCPAEALVRSASTNRPAYLHLVTGGVTTNGYIAHGADAPYLFDTLEQRGIPVDQAAIDLRSALQSAVKNMAASPSAALQVDAGSTGVFDWPAYSAGDVKVVEFGAPVAIATAHRSGRCVVLGTLLSP